MPKGKRFRVKQVQRADTESRYREQVQRAGTESRYREQAQSASAEHCVVEKRIIGL